MKQPRMHTFQSCVVIGRAPSTIGQFLVLVGDDDPIRLAEFTRIPLAKALSGASMLGKRTHLRVGTRAPWTTCANACTHVHMARVANRQAVTARLSPDVVAALERVSASEGEPVSRMINRLLRQKLEELGALPKRSAVVDQ